VAVDPGDRHVGIAVWALTDTTAWETDAEFAVDEIAELLKTWSLPSRKVLVVEEFRLYAGKAQAQSWSPMETSQMIGALKWVAKECGVEVVEQGAGIKKPTAAQLKARGVMLRGRGGHARDAELHLWHYLLKEKIVRREKVDGPQD